MKVVKVQYKQTIIDIAVQELGDASRAIEIAVLNNLNLTDDLVSGTTLILPVPDLDKRWLVNLFKDKANHPASCVTADEEVKLEGIGYWYIEYDFVVQ